ncbi:uncharacterized protein PgNI_08955 [Pyricularia grisea]|uniref:Uncharacterized protein n=1 Tax=Pyricularia grisea TaxID=148305 RepID=A0A6P8AUE5_PYRGI|nr:uncharacterized protein PgNI_08955 [Pyricularia grisea]TLD05784.1 hypothetical protein PgNI_08955 [Pyricularia grisea]
MSCADPGLLLENCPAINLCHDETPDSPGLLRQCPKSETKWFCLRPDVWEDNCVNASLWLAAGYVDDGRNGNLSGILLAHELEVSQNGTVDEQVPVATPNNSNHDNTIAVGASLGALLLAAAAAAVFFWRRWKAVLHELDVIWQELETTSPPDINDRRQSLKRVPSVAEVAFPDDRSELPQTGPCSGLEIHEADAGQVFEVHGTSKYMPSTRATSLLRLPSTVASSPRTMPR